MWELVIAGLVTYAIGYVSGVQDFLGIGKRLNIGGRNLPDE